MFDKKVSSSMTQVQRVEFQKYGCLSRAIMRVCGQNAVEDFCAKFEKWFRHEYYGMPQGDKVEAILNDLGYTAIADENDFTDVLRRFQNGNAVIVLSHVSLNGDDSSVINHASVLYSITANSFQLWTTSQDGWEGLLPLFAREKWAGKKCHGLSVRLKTK
jgi:hypothetical protein